MFVRSSSCNQKTPYCLSPLHCPAFGPLSDPNPNPNTNAIPHPRTPNAFNISAAASITFEPVENLHTTRWNT